MTQKIFTNLEEAITNFGLDFGVEKVPLYTNKGGLMRIPDKVAIRRVDSKQVLGFVSESYPDTNPIERFTSFQPFSDKKLIEFVDGGVYGGGSRIYLEARLPNSINVNPEVGDTIEKRITFYSSYDGTISNQVAIRPLRLVCTNGMTIRSTEWEKKFKNTKNASYTSDEIMKAIEAGIAEYANYEEFIDAAVNSREYSEQELQKFIELVIPTPNNKEKVSKLVHNRRFALEESIHSAIGQDVIAGMTAYKMYQGTLAFTEHILSKEVNDAHDYVNFGGGSRINRQAMNVITEMLRNDMALA